MKRRNGKTKERKNEKTKERISFFVSLFFSSLVLWFFSSNCFADTIYLKDGSTQKGLVVEEHYDRFILSTPDGEREILKSDIDEIFFDEPYQNNLYIGKRFEDEGNFENALKFYRLALQSNPGFREAEDAMKGIEDAKWRFGKRWSYRELKAILKGQLGISLKKVKREIVIDRGKSDLLPGDRLISCWARPLTYGGLKNASRLLTGLSNTILKVVVERAIKVEVPGAFRLFSPLKLNMELKGPVVRFVERGSPYYNSGLRQGDLIVKIGGEGTRYIPQDKLNRRLFSKEASKAITIRREVTLMRKRPENNNNRKNAMWAWHSREVLLNEAKRKELLRFCKEKNIGVLFLQLQYRWGQFSKRELPPRVACRILHEARLRAFLEEAHSQGIEVHALDGAPEFCLESQHPFVLAQVAALLDFNKKGQPTERFDGVHYDNEPYLLPAFNSGLKEKFISQFLALNRKCRALIDASGLKFDFGIDIPFWFDELNSLDRKLIDICDNVGIMDYRNFASGPDGIVAHALDELRYASRANKKVFVGVETSRYPVQEVYFVALLNEEELNSKRLNSTRFENFPLRAHYDEKKFYIGLVKPAGADEGRFKEALSKLQALVGKQAQPADSEASIEFVSSVLFALSTNPEFADTRPQEYIGEDGRVFLMFVAKEVMLQKITFAGMTEVELNNVLAEAKKEFKNYPAFAGFAIHHYKSYKELCEKKEVITEIKK